MARRTKLVTISAEGRDKGKQFHITEMPSDQGEKWSYRTLLALSRGGIELPPGIFDQGFSGLAAVMPYVLIIGLRSLHGAQWAEIEPLLDEMMSCVRFLPAGAGGNLDVLQNIHAGVDSQIEEVRTRGQLKKEVLEVHLGFSVADALSSMGNRPQEEASA